MKRIITQLAIIAAAVPCLAQSITVTSSRYVAQGSGNMTVHYEGAPVGTDAWIGIYKSGDHKHAKNSYKWAYTSGASGDVTFDLGDWDAYYAVLFSDGGYDEIARSEYVLACNDYNGAKAEAFTLNTDKNVYQVGEPVNISWTNAPAVDKDWIAIYSADKYPGLVGSSESYEYVGGQTSGSMTLNVDGNQNYTEPLPAGNYYVTYLLWDGYAEIFERVPFTVVETMPEVSVGPELYATYVAPTDVDFASCAEVKAFTVTSIEGGYITLNEVERVPAGTAVVVKADAADTYTLAPAASCPAIGTNLLQASEGIDFDPAATVTNYILSQQEGKVGFYPVASGYIPEGVGYLQIASSEAKAFYSFEGTTAIGSIMANGNGSDTIYSLSGQRVQKMQKGINIINGIKVLK